MTQKEQYKEVLRRLRKHYTKAPDTFVVWSTPLELVIATVLSAQCTDKRVNLTTPALFARYPDAAALAGADSEELEQLIHATGAIYDAEAPKKLTSKGPKQWNHYRESFYSKPNHEFWPS